MMKYYFIIFLALTLLIGCSEEVTDNKNQDKAPNTFLFLYPDDGAQLNRQKSRIAVHWWSDDPDGVVVGYIFKWDGIDANWSFTTKNDSTFSLPIGTADTNYVFLVAAIDNNGNGIYDADVSYNGVSIGGEPFKDANNNGRYDEGEEFTDFGNIDPTPANSKFPIKNTAPTIKWNKLSVLPSETYPVITLGWEAADLDGDESITKINIALNDTNNFVSIKGTARLVTLRCKNFNDSNPTMEILIDGLEGNLQAEKLNGIKLDNFNKIYIQAVDISGAKSSFSVLPEEGTNWYVRKPKGKLLVIDDYNGGASAESFYKDAFDNISNGALASKYDTYNMEAIKLPYATVTFLETMKLFKYIYWYTDTSPSMDLAAISTQKYIQTGGKIAFSMVFQDSSDTFPFDKSYLQNFLPIDSLGQKKPLNFLLTGATLMPSISGSGYPILKTSATISWVRTYGPNASSSKKVYDLTSNSLNGNIGFMDNGKTLFFIGLPLHLCDGNSGTVKQLLEKVFFEEFGYNL